MAAGIMKAVPWLRLRGCAVHHQEPPCLNHFQVDLVSSRVRPLH